MRSMLTLDNKLRNERENHIIVETTLKTSLDKSLEIQDNYKREIDETKVWLEAILLLLQND